MCARRLVVMAGLMLVSGVSDAGGELSVMSFNIRYGTADDGANAWQNRKNVVVDMIKHYHPDILGLQEALAMQVDYLRAELPEYDAFGADRDANGNGERMTVLYRKDDFVPLTTGNFWLSDTPGVPASNTWGAACNRMVTWAEFLSLRDRSTFVFFNTHFDHVSSGARLGSARLLAGRVAAVSGAPVIVTGDFNSSAPDSEPYKLLAASGLRDAWPIASERRGPESTLSGWGPPKEGANRRIDWTLVCGGIDVTLCETVTYNSGGRYPSDHYPVYSKLIILE